MKQVAEEVRGKCFTSTVDYKQIFILQKITEMKLRFNLFREAPNRFFVLAALAGVVVAVCSIWLWMENTTAVDYSPATDFGSADAAKPARHWGRERAVQPKGSGNERRDVQYYIDLWEQEMDGPHQDQSEFISDLGSWITALAIDGYGEEALTLITDSFGPGSIRCRLIRSLFRASEAKDIKRLFDMLEHDDEKAAACEGVGQMLVFLAPPGNVDDFQLPVVWRDKVLGSYAAKLVFQQLSASEEQISGAFKSAFELPLSKDSARRVLLEVHSLAPFDCWQKLNEIDVSLSENERNMILSRMVVADPMKALENVAVTNNGDEELGVALKKWLELDARKPVEWLQSNRSNLSTSQFDVAVMSVAEFAASHGETDVAREWVARIENGDLRKHFEEQISRQE